MDIKNRYVGFEAQSPMGDGCQVVFEVIDFTEVAVKDIRCGL